MVREPRGNACRPFANCEVARGGRGEVNRRRRRVEVELGFHFFPCIYMETGLSGS
jgi:hypothetical protein